MDKVEIYRSYIREVLTEIGNYKSLKDNYETQLVFDTEHDHYQIVHIGWDEYKRIYSCPIHIDIKDGNIWIQRNMTDINIAEEFLEKGVPKEDIVLGLYHPYKRPYTGFGVDDKAA